MVRWMSQASASFVMLDDAATAVMKALGQELTPQGVWTVEQIPGVLARLEAALHEAAEAAREADRRTQAALDQAVQAAAGDTQALETIQQLRRPPVGLHQRLVPVKEMLRRALEAEKPVVWERQSF